MTSGAREIAMEAETDAALASHDADRIDAGGRIDAYRSLDADRPTPGVRLVDVNRDVDRGPAPLGMPRVLRFVGGGLLVAAASTFMVHHWKAGDDIARYLWLVGLTWSVCATGWFCGLRLADGRGARTLLGLVLAIAPVHFAVLGGLLYSQFALDPTPLSVGRALWEAPSPFAALLAAGLGVALLWPMCWLSLRVFVRDVASRLATAFVLTNATVLVPLREPSAVAWLVLGAAGIVVYLQQRVFVGSVSLTTGEGRVARALLAVPLAILVGRTLWLYEPTQAFTGAVWLAASVIAFLKTPLLSDSPEKLSGAQTFAGLTAAYGASLLSSAFVESAHLDGIARIPAYGLPIACVWLALSYFAIAPAALRRSAALALASTAVLTLADVPGTAATLFCILVGLGTLAHGMHLRQLSVAASGALALSVGVIYELQRIIDVELLTHWMTLSALGLALVVGAAYVERHARAWRLRATRLRTELGEWEI